MGAHKRTKLVAVAALVGLAWGCAEGDPFPMPPEAQAPDLTEPTEDLGVDLHTAPDLTDDAAPDLDSDLNAPEDLVDAPEDLATDAFDDATDMVALDIEPSPEDLPPDEPPPPDPVEGCPQVRVQGTGGQGLNVRPSPSTDQPPRGNLPEGTVADVLDIVEGESIQGDTTWFQVRRGDLEGFVSGAFAACYTPPEPGETDEVFLLPFPCGETRLVTQGNNSQFSHSGRSAWAFDFSLGTGTPLLAMKPGVVLYTYDRTRPGDPCYDGGGRECNPATNYVALRHDDGTRTQYLHMSRVDVRVGDQVAQGQSLGASGSTGWSTGPHAHVERQEDCGASFCQSIPMSFADVAGDGVPVQGQSVTSGNGCR
jgi:hypothetical protein